MGRHVALNVCLQPPVNQQENNHQDRNKNRYKNECPFGDFALQVGRSRNLSQFSNNFVAGYWRRASAIAGFRSVLYQVRGLGRSCLWFRNFLGCGRGGRSLEHQPWDGRFGRARSGGGGFPESGFLVAALLWINWIVCVGLAGLLWVRHFYSAILIFVTTESIAHVR